MSDFERSHIHLSQSRISLFFDEWNKCKLEFDDILVAPEHEPINPEDDDDIIPDQQHASFGLAKSHQNNSRSHWKDLKTKELLFQGPNSGVSMNEVLDFPNFNPRPALSLPLTSSSDQASRLQHIYGRGRGGADTPIFDKTEDEEAVPPTNQPEISLLLQDDRANARRASSMVTPTYNSQHVTIRSRTNALRSNRLATSTQRRQVPR
jgi:hypothetical protein